MVTPVALNRKMALRCFELILSLISRAAGAPTIFTGFGPGGLWPGFFPVWPPGGCPPGVGTTAGMPVLVPTTTCPALSTATHSLVAGQSTAVNEFAPLMGVTVHGPPLGSPARILPSASTATQLVVDGHDMAVREWPLSISTKVVVIGVAGLKVISCPLVLTAVHWLMLGQAMPSSAFPASIVSVAD
jgi:hypothetical protein